MNEKNFITYIIGVTVLLFFYMLIDQNTDIFTTINNSSTGFKENLDRNPEPKYSRAATPAQEVKIEIGEQQYWSNINHSYSLPEHYVEIIAVTDEVKLKRLVLNRGNCPDIELENSALNPNILKFGMRRRVYMSCNPIEVKVQTSRGTWTFNFE